MKGEERFCFRFNTRTIVKGRSILASMPHYYWTWRAEGLKF